MSLFDKNSYLRKTDKVESKGFFSIFYVYYNTNFSQVFQDEIVKLNIFNLINI